MVVTLSAIKEFAHSQLKVEAADAKVYVFDGENTIVDPWFSIVPSRRYLSDREARDFWGDDIVNEFITKARAYLEKQND